MSTWTRVGAASMPAVIDESWREHASCAGLDPRPWDPADAAPTAADVARWRTAVPICAVCPVLVACAAAVTRADAGTVRAGGLVGNDGRIGPIRSTTGRPFAPCGTTSARDRHRRAGEHCPTCAQTWGDPR